MAPRPPDIPDDEEAWLDTVEAFYERRGYAHLAKLFCLHGERGS
jgi:hypothetical protein